MATSSNQEIIDCANAAKWETWLESHYQRQDGVWLKIAKKGSGKTSVTISEALDIALCYGWIDSQRKGYDQTYYLQRYSPRRSKSPWSKLNVERAEALIVAGRMQPAGLREIKVAKKMVDGMKLMNHNEISLSRPVLKQSLRRIHKRNLRLTSWAKLSSTQDEPWGYSANFADLDGHHWEISYMPGNA